MSFANPLPWWALVAAVFVAAVTAVQAYRHFHVAPSRRAILIGVRCVTLLALVVFLMRPVVRTDRADARHVVVPVLVDVSRSMGIQDVDGARRIDQARTLVSERLAPSLASRFDVEVLGFGDDLQALSPDTLSATARRSDLQSALAAVRERYRGRAVAGVIVLTDGGDTSGAGERAARDAGFPLFPIGIGSAALSGDREILSVTSAEAVMDDSRLDLAVSAVSHAAAAESIELRLLENGRPIEVRRVSAGNGTPIREIFQVSPRPGSATVYAIETPAGPGELVPENNARSVLVQSPSRPRRVLLVEGAPGFEHSFLKRTWSMDKGLEVDSVVRKGKNEQGSDTFYIQAVRSRSDALAAGYPSTVASLFAYDAIVLANIDGNMLTRAQLDATREFVGRRGGGLLVLGARSFVRQGLLDTALEEVLPLQLSDRGGGVLPASASGGLNRVALTVDGVGHPIMQLTADAAETRKRWEAVPSLASIAPLGGPRPGASVLAVTSGASGTARALVAVQRYGDGRAMVFAGEAAWRWRMLLPSSDRLYDTFWRQAIRWLALRAPAPVDVTAPAGAAAGDPVTLSVVVRDEEFRPQTDAAVDVRVSGPDGRLEHLRATLDSAAAAEGRYVASYRPAQAGVYRVTADVRRGNTAVGSGSASVLVGGADLEMADPRLNTQLLHRIALASGGQVMSADDVDGLSDKLISRVPAASAAVTRDLWHNAWSFVAILVLLGSEWSLRRRWGLR